MENKHIQQVDFSNPNALKINSGTTVKQMQYKKQTAVDWLWDVLTTTYWDYKTIEEQKEIIEQAKQMEKEQIFDYIKENYVNGENSLKFHQDEFEKYYNNNFGVK